MLGDTSERVLDLGFQVVGEIRGLDGAGVVDAMLSVRSSVMRLSGCLFSMNHTPIGRDYEERNSSSGLGLLYRRIAWGGFVDTHCNSLTVFGCLCGGVERKTDRILFVGGHKRCICMSLSIRLLERAALLGRKRIDSLHLFFPTLSEGKVNERKGAAEETNVKSTTNSSPVGV